MQYEIIRNRGVLKKGNTFLLNESNPLVIEFNNLDGTNILVLKRAKSADKEIVVPFSNIAEIDVSRLRAGVYNVEVKRVENEKVVDVIICNPIVVNTLSGMNGGLIAYPEIDSVMTRLAEVEDALADLLDWQESVKDKIHEHKIIL